MKRRTRLRKLGLFSDAPKPDRRREHIADQTQALQQELCKAGMDPYLARFAVADARKYGVEQVAKCWLATGLTKVDAQAHSFRGGSSGTHPVGMPSKSPVFCGKLNDESRSRCANTHLLYTYREVQRHGFYHHNKNFQVQALSNEAPRGRYV